MQQTISTNAETLEAPQAPAHTTETLRRPTNVDAFFLSREREVTHLMAVADYGCAARAALTAHTAYKDSNHRGNFTEHAVFWAGLCIALCDEHDAQAAYDEKTWNDAIHKTWEDSDTYTWHQKLKAARAYYAAHA